MGLFGNKKDTTAKKAPAAPKALATDRNLDGVLVKYRLSEKSVNLGDQNVYVFVVRKDANKHQVKEAVKAFYNVTPVKVNIVNKQPAKRLRGSTGKQVHEKGMKKAYVYLKKGETISLV